MHVRSRSRGELVERAAERGHDLAQDLARDLAAAAGPVRDRVVESAGELVVAARPVALAAVETASGVLDGALVRGSAAWEALRHETAAPVRARRWPYALAAALAGAVAGATAVRLLRAVAPADAPDAQEPHELRAVIDTADPLTGLTRP